jgi:hypothetical protein
VTSQIPRYASLTYEKESVLSTLSRGCARFARFSGQPAAACDNEVCPGRGLARSCSSFLGCGYVGIGHHLAVD